VCYVISLLIKYEHGSVEEAGLAQHAARMYQIPLFTQWEMRRIREITGRA
jgi:hypothetical protein